MEREVDGINSVLTRSTLGTLGALFCLRTGTDKYVLIIKFQNIWTSYFYSHVKAKFIDSEGMAAPGWSLISTSRQSKWGDRKVQPHVWATAALSRKPWEPANLMVLEASLADGDTIWIHWHLIIDESHLRSLEFRGKPRFHMWITSFLFSNSFWLITEPWVETRCLTLGHQAPTQPELFIRKLDFLTNQSLRLGILVHGIIIKWLCHVSGWRKYILMEKVSCVKK